MERSNNTKKAKSFGFVRSRHVTVTVAMLSLVGIGMMPTVNANRRTVGRTGRWTQITSQNLNRGSRGFERRQIDYISIGPNADLRHRMNRRSIEKAKPAAYLKKCESLLAVLRESALACIGDLLLALARTFLDCP